MKSLNRSVVALILLFLLSSSVITFAQSIDGRVIAWNLNVRSTPAVESDNTIGQLTAQTPVIIEGRTPANDWLYIRTQDGSLAGWASSSYIDYDASQLDLVPIRTESAPPVVAGEGEASTTETIITPPTSTPEFIPEASESFIMETPIFHNMTTSTVYTVFARGQRLGNNARTFMKVGDSVTATQPFLAGFGSSNYDLGSYANLQATIDFFSVSPARNVSNSFVQNSVAAVNGFVSGAVFDGTWSPPYCGQLVPLECEYDIVRPSVAIVLFGGQDVRLFDALFFQQNMRRIAVDLKSLGVIPVFTTFPMHASYRYDQTIQYNTIVINLANEMDIPLINLYRALQALPDGGAKPDDVVHLTQGERYFHFNGDEALYGVTLRNLLTLQALDVLRREVLQR